MFLFVGLGNPSRQYEQTRHNVGFMVLDAFAKKHELPEFTFSKKSDSLFTEGTVGEQKVLLAKPQTFMNKSGDAVKLMYAKYKIRDTRCVVVIHDDIDLPVGHIKISVGSGSAGHKGVESIISALDTQDFARIRIGIQPLGGKPDDVENFVLKKFSKEELKILSAVIKNSFLALETTLRDGLEKAMAKYN